MQAQPEAAHGQDQRQGQGHVGHYRPGGDEEQRRTAQQDAGDPRLPTIFASLPVPYQPQHQHAQQPVRQAAGELVGAEQKLAAGAEPEGQRRLAQNGTPTSYQGVIQSPSSAIFRATSP